MISVFLLFPFSYPFTAKDATLWGLLVTSSSSRKSSLTTMSLTLIHMRGSRSSFCVLSHFSHFWLFATLWTVELPDSSVHGIHQASILEWVATPSSRGSSQTRDRTCVSCITGGFFTTEPAEKLFLGAPKALVICPMIGFATHYLYVLVSYQAPRRGDTAELYHRHWASVIFIHSWNISWALTMCQTLLQGTGDTVGNQTDTAPHLVGLTFSWVTDDNLRGLLNITADCDQCRERYKQGAWSREASKTRIR